MPRPMPLRHVLTRSRAVRSALLRPEASRAPTRALGATALVTALAGATAVPSLVPAEAAPAGSLSARAAVAPTPVEPAGLAEARAQQQRAAQADVRAALQADRARAAQAQRAREAQRASRARREASADPRSIARAMLAARGQSGSWSCLDRLWTRESEWRVTATNPSSGAYGIPQALPASKLASAGADWRTSARTQVRWGLDYIAGRYGTPCAAWSHSQSVGWY